MIRRSRRSHTALALVLGLALSAGTATADAAPVRSLSPHGEPIPFTCVKRTSARPPATVAPPSVNGRASTLSAAARRADAQRKPLCPTGQAPMPAALHAPVDVDTRSRGAKRGRARSHARGLDAPAMPGDAAHRYAVAHDLAPSSGAVSEIWGYQSNEKPFVDLSGSDPWQNFSLSQLWFVDASTGESNVSTVELGWQVYPEFYGDLKPHLFLFGAKQGYTSDSCYVRPNVSSCVSHWHPYDATYMPTSVVSTGDGVHKYGIVRTVDGYWVSYDDHWLGYLDTSYWTHYPTYLSRLDAGGEIAAADATTCTDMGNGALGTDPQAAVWQQVYYVTTGGTTTNAQFEVSSTSGPLSYTLGNAWPSSSNYSAFRYGGPGDCANPGAPTPSAVREASGKQHVFVRGEDGRVWDVSKASSATTWTPTRLGTTVIVGSPSAVVDAFGNVVVFFRGTDSHIHQYVYASGTWQHYDLGGSAASDPDSVTASSGQSWVAFRGTDGHIWQLFYDGTWHLNDLGGSATGTPSVVREAGNNQAIYFRGTDGAIKQLYYDGTWHLFGLGGSAAGSPSAIIEPGGNHSVMFRGTDGQIDQLYHTGSTWYLWGLGGEPGGDPTNFTEPGGNASVYYRGNDGTLKQLIDSGGWHSYGLGGTLRGAPTALVDASGNTGVFSIGAEDSLVRSNYSGGWNHTTICSGPCGL